MVATTEPLIQPATAVVSIGGHTVATANFWEKTLDDPIALFTLGLLIATSALCWYTARLWRSTVALSKDAKSTGDIQADRMQRSIEEAGRAASAMEGVAASMHENTKLVASSVATNQQIGETQKRVSEMQLRAYISVVIGGAVYQERDKGLRFEGKPTMINSGQTPARKIVHTVRAAVLPVPLPANYDLRSADSSATGDSMLPSQQTRTMSAVVDSYIDDAEVAQIMRGDGSALYVWGTVAYEDAFDNSRLTEFCHSIAFWPNQAGNGYTVEGYYTPGRNTAN